MGVSFLKPNNSQSKRERRWLSPLLGWAIVASLCQPVFGLTPKNDAEPGSTLDLSWDKVYGKDVLGYVILVKNEDTDYTRPPYIIWGNDAESITSSGATQQGLERFMVTFRSDRVSQYFLPTGNYQFRIKTLGKGDKPGEFILSDVSKPAGDDNNGGAKTVFIESKLIGDADKDGLADIFETESVFGTDPNSSDTDGDGVPDFDELFLTRTNPNLSGDVDVWKSQLQKLFDAKLINIDKHYYRWKTAPGEIQSIVPALDRYARIRVVGGVQYRSIHEEGSHILPLESENYKFLIPGSLTFNDPMFAMARVFKLSPTLPGFQRPRLIMEMNPQDISSRWKNAGFGIYDGNGRETYLHRQEDSSVAALPIINGNVWGMEMRSGRTSSVKDRLAETIHVTRPDSAMKKIFFNGLFSEGDVPIVFPATQSYVESDLAVLRIKNVTRSGFEVAMQEQAAAKADGLSSGNHEPEDLAYTAILPGTYDFSDKTIIVGQLTIKKNRYYSDYSGDREIPDVDVTNNGGPENYNPTREETGSFAFPPKFSKENCQIESKSLDGIAGSSPKFKYSPDVKVFAQIQTYDPKDPDQATVRYSIRTDESGQRTVFFRITEDRTGGIKPHIVDEKVGYMIVIPKIVGGCK